MQIVTAAILRRSGRVLVMRRAPGRSNAGLWEFPGGKLEVGESPQACLTREMREETGLQGRAGALVGKSTTRDAGGEISLWAYEFIAVEGEPALRVHDALCWATPQEVQGMCLSAADIPIARMLMGVQDEKQQ